ncbi:MAG: hypothetical protein EON86_04945 [Brevundimonas sp.]|nr:MAG: hypothetical protein EON86_04945 [Brevundimonas sp.]
MGGVFVGAMRCGRSAFLMDWLGPVCRGAGWNSGVRGMSIWLALAALANLAAADPSTVKDWGQTLRDDATAVHAEIASSHPGMVNADDPGFASLNDAQYRLALERAGTADSYEDYFFALQHYVAAFNDGHLSFGVYGATPDQPRRWPGFIARDDGNRGLVVTHAEPWSGLAVGATVVSCDGRDAFHLGEARIGARLGRWALASERVLNAPMVMLDTGDPYVPPLRHCEFDVAGVRLAKDLEWRDAGQRFYSHYDVFALPPPGAIKMRRLQDGGVWISLPTFDGNPESEAGRDLGALVTAIETQAETLRQSPAIVFDLRGNTGGSSQWSVQIARTLWGSGAFSRTPEAPMTVVWRASAANLESLRETLQQRDARGAISNEARDWFRSTIAGLEAAIARGDDRWIIEPSVSAPSLSAPTLPYHPPVGGVFVLTDETCMSACLDAVDLWVGLGAVPVGRETGADTIYMETRSFDVPSGLGAMSLPMKFYIGRRRGHNEPVSPVHRFDGDMNNTEALEVWLSGLPR